MSDLFGVGTGGAGAGGLEDPFTVDPFAPPTTAAPGTVPTGPATPVPLRALDAFRGVATSPVSLLGNTLPAAALSPVGLAPSRAPRVDPNYQRNLQTLTNKYADLAPQIAALPEPVRNALIDYDSQRVARGSSPLTRKQTMLATQAATTGQPATPAPDRNPLNLLGNVRSDLGDILKSIPRLPVALLHELKEIPSAGEHIAAAQEAGANPIAAIAGAPGVRLLPGAYVAEGLASGAEGIERLITHPVMTGLDVLPAAGKAAGATRVGRLAEEVAVAAGKRPRPLSAVLANKVVQEVDPATGATIDVLARNRAGQTFDHLRDSTRLGQVADAAFGSRSRDIMRQQGLLQQRHKMLLQGYGVPENRLEALLPDVDAMFKRHTETYPQLAATDETGAAWRAQAAQDFQRGNTASYDPAFVTDYRDMVDRIGKVAADEGVVARFGDELFPPEVAKTLRSRESQVRSTQYLMAARNEYLNPSGQFDAGTFRRMADDALDETNLRARAHAARATIQTLDAYGYDVRGAQSALTAINRRRGSWEDWRATVDGLLDTAAPAPRRTADEIVATLRRVTDDRQVTLLESAIRNGKRGQASTALKNLYARKPPRFPDAEWPGLRDDIVSLSRRMAFDDKIGRRATPARLARQQKSLDDAIAANPPARYDALLADDLRTRQGAEITARREAALGRSLTAEELAEVTLAVQERRWQAALPDEDPAQVAAYMGQLEREVKRTWVDLRAAGHDPPFVHRVSPGRATAVQSSNIGPVPQKPSQGKERALDLSPSVDDLQVSLTHQASELLTNRYREQYAEQIVESVGMPEAALREELAPWARLRAASDPAFDFEAHLQAEVRRGYEKFNPDEAGMSWGGARLDKYRQEAWYIPRSVADNLHRLSQPPGLASKVFDPFTKAFRYNVIGLSPSIAINNFFSNSVAMLAETGPGPLRYWGKAMEWVKDPAKIPTDELRAIMTAENPAMPTLNRGNFQRSRSGQRYLMGLNAGTAFRDSAVAQAARTGKRAMDVVVEKNLRLQQMGDNMFRGMTAMHAYDRALGKGATAERAAQEAVEQVRRVLVDYTAFTPIERSAIRTIIPFYSYMGHAARFVMRYPLDHPIRASVTAKLAAAERERLGALPDSFLGLIPVGDTDAKGNKTMVSLRPFDPFGDVGDLFSVAGWLGATNPLITTALESVGVERGEAEMYPTLRYDAESGRMRPVHGGLFSNLLENTLPRAGLITAALGMNSSLNETRRRDPGAANRSLLTMAGLPRSWREVNVPREQFTAEVARQRSASTVENEALRTGNWREALRYPTLGAYYDQLRQVPETHLADYIPEDPAAIAERLRQTLGA